MQTDLSLVHFSPKRRAVFRMLLGLLSLLLLGQGCQKEVLQPDGMLPTTPKPAQSIGTATYDAAHDVLVFTSFQQVRDLSDALDQLRDNYPYNQGNTASIQATMQQIQSHGYYQGTNGNPNQVSLDNFEQLLLNSYPLSNDILKGLVQLNDNLNGGLPGQFMATVLTANVPFTYEVAQAVANGQLQNSIQQAILTADDNTTLVPDHAYDDFLRQYPAFNSLYEALEAQDKLDLESGMDPGSQQYDTDFVREDFMRLILNTEKEVYIEGNLYKLYTDCQMAIFQGTLTEAYAERNMLNPAGYAFPPVGVPETPAGLPMATMESYFPMDFAMVEPAVYDPVTNTAADHQQDFRPNCPEAAFNVHRDESTWLLYHFDRYDPVGYTGTDYYVYWTFGDGTGSFEANPSHLYASSGVYYPKLTVFKADCGCWDTYTWRIVTNTPNQDRGSCEATFDWSYGTPINNIDFTVDFTWDEAGAPVTNVAWDFGDGGTSPTNAGLTTSHAYGANGVYTVKMTVSFASGCSYEYEKLVSIVSFVQCCDLLDGFVDPTYDPFGFDDHRLVLEDFARGHHWLWGAKIVGKQTFYKRKSSTKWKKAKAAHLVILTGSAQELDGEKLCFGPDVAVPPGVDEDEDNSKCCKLSLGSGEIGGLNGFGMQDNSLQIEHRVSYGGWIMTGKMVLLGDC